MNLKVYDSHGNWAHVSNAINVEQAKKYARDYAKLSGELRVVELRVVEFPIENDPVKDDPVGA